MLVLARRLNERLIIPCIQTTVQVVAIKSSLVRLGVEAPPEVVVCREEVFTDTSAWTSPGGLNSEAQLRRVQDILRTKLNNLHLGLTLATRQLATGLPEKSHRTLDKLNTELETLCRQLNTVLDMDPEALPERSLAGCD